MKKKLIVLFIILLSAYAIFVKQYKLFPYQQLKSSKQFFTNGKKYLPSREPNNIITYKKIDNIKLNLHIFNPPNHKESAKRPAIIFFFGGSWITGTPRQFFPQCEYLSALGIVCISAEYRIEKKHKTSPQECVKDAKSAIRWVRKHAESLGINPDKLAAGGASAGGHIAAATGVLKSFEDENEDESISSKPNALILFNPVFDNGPTGYGHERVKEYWKEFSPMHNIGQGTPPTIIFLGTNDRYIPVETAKKYKLLLEENNARCDLHLYKDQKHGFFNISHFQETIKESEDFLRSLGYIK